MILNFTIKCQNCKQGEMISGIIHSAILWTDPAAYDMMGSREKNNCISPEEDPVFAYKEIQC